MKTQIEILKTASRNIVMVFAALLSFGVSFAGNGPFNNTVSSGEKMFTSEDETKSATEILIEKAKPALFLKQDVADLKTFHIVDEPKGETNPVVRVYNAAGKLVLFQSWTGNYSMEEMLISIPEKLTHGTYNAVIISGNEAWKQALTW